MNEERTKFILWYSEFWGADEMLSAHVWDSNHRIAQAWCAALVAAPAQAAAPTQAGGLIEQDCGLLEQAASMLDALANDERNRGNCSTAEGADCSANAVRRLASVLHSADLSARGASPAQPVAQIETERLRCSVGNCMFNGEVDQHAPDCAAATSKPAAQAQEDAPDMFWDADDTENFAHEIQDIVDGYGLGEIVTIECAKRMPNFRVLITGEGDSLSYEHIDAAIAAQQGAQP